jgi:hypothetical protein
MIERKYDEISVKLDENEASEMIEKVARFIAERHLAPAGILFIESVRPLHGIGSQLLYFILPFAEIIFDSQKYQRFALMLEKEDYLKRLVNRIDELDEELNRERRKQAHWRRVRRKNKIKGLFQKIFTRK